MNVVGVFEIIGIVAVFTIFLFAIAIISYILIAQIKKLIVKHKIKTRYKKLPTAKCYCRDCSKFEPKTGECCEPCNSKYMSPTWFCCFAEPLTGNKFKEREKLMEELGDNWR